MKFISLKNATVVVVLISSVSLHAQVDSTGVIPLRGNVFLSSSVMPTNTSQGLGYNQTWQSSPKVANTWYQNDTGRPIMVLCAHIYGAGVWYVGPSPSSYVGIQFDDLDSDLDNPSMLLVPPSHWYYRTRSCSHGYYELR